MSEISQETTCASCIHRNVCFLMADFQTAQRAIDEAWIYSVLSEANNMVKIKELTFIKPIKLFCIHYMFDLNEKLNKKEIKNNE